VSHSIRTLVERNFPDADAGTLVTAVWAVVHGLAFLFLDGKLDTSTPTAVAEHITTVIRALLPRVDGA
jgi:hypothetical protein